MSSSPPASSSPSDRGTDSTLASRLVALASRLVRGLAGLLVLAAAVGIYMALMATAQEPSRRDIEQARTRVQTVPVTQQRVARQWEGYGTARAMQAADVSAQLTARVVARDRAIEEGVFVAKGDVLVELDAIDFEAQLISRQKAVTALESEIAGLEIELRSLNERLELGDDELEIERRLLERFTEAQSRGGANTLDLDRTQSVVRRLEREIATIRQQVRLIDTRRARLEAELADAVAQVRKAEEDVARATIRSPIGGVLQRMDVEVGELLTSGTMVGRVVDLSLIEVPLRVPVSAAATIRVGDRVEVRTDSAASRSWEGTVARIAPEADEARRTITVFAEVRQEVGFEDGGGLVLEDLLLPGQFVMGRVFTEVQAERWIVPRSSLQNDRVLTFESLGEGQEVVARWVPVRVRFQFSGAYPSVHPFETQWAAIEPVPGAVMPEQIIVSNLETLTDGANILPEPIGGNGADGAPALTSDALDVNAQGAGG